MDIIGRSLSAAAVIAVIIFMRKALFRKLPKRMLSALWLIAAAKLLLPLGGLTLIGTGASDTDVTEAVYSASAVPAVPNAVINVAMSVPASENEAFILRCIWLFGAISVGAYFVLSHIRSRRTFSCALPADYDIEPLKKDFGIKRSVRLLVSDRTDCPLTYGIFAPVVILPKNVDLNGDGVRNILCHELAHIKRFDALFKAVIALCAAVHWFDPLVWIMFVLANRDIELACDETALRRGRSAPEDYAMTLIQVEESRIPAAGSFHFAGSFAGGKLEERIKDVMYAKKSFIAGLFAAAVSAAAAASLNVTVIHYGEIAYDTASVYEYSVTSDDDVYYSVTEDAPGVYSLHSYKTAAVNGTADTAIEEACYSDTPTEEVLEADYLISVADDVPSIAVDAQVMEVDENTLVTKAWNPPQGYYTVVYDYSAHDYAHAYTETEKGGAYTDTTVVVTVAGDGSETSRQTKITPIQSR